MIVLERIGSFDLLGVEINENMDIHTLLTALNLGFVYHPELLVQFVAVMPLLDAVKIADELVESKMAIIVGLKNNVTTAKRTLQTAVKLYNVGSAISMKLLDTKPAINGSPPGTGAEVYLNPLKTAVETATMELQDLEDEITDGLAEFSLLYSQYKEDLNTAVKSLMSKIAELGKKNITIE